MNIKQINEEFDKECKESDLWVGFTDRAVAKSFFKAKINQIIDECIGEEEHLNAMPSNEERHMRVGYNLKRKELKKYKEEFNI